jgi:hypothetical protein
MPHPRQPLTLPSTSESGATLSKERATLVVFLKNDCQTCRLVVPLLSAIERAYGDQLDIRFIGQSGADNIRLQEAGPLVRTVEDDADLQFSFAWNFDIVPAVFLVAPNDELICSYEGFVKSEWQDLAQKLALLGEAATLDIAWDEYPDWRPGCGSRHLEPEINDRLQAQAAGSPLRARRIEIADQDDPIEFMFDQGFSDGLPLVPPTPERVLRMLRGTSRSAQEVIAHVPPNMAPATVEKIAINAVMAGCLPQYLPVVIAALEAVCTDAFNIHGVNATTMGAAPVLVVNGPVASRIGMNARFNALGSGNRANATIGRALRLVIRNIGGSRPGGTDRSTLGSPMKYTIAFGELEEQSPWDPLHVERGFRKTDSVVTAFAMTGGPVHIVDQESRLPDQIAGSLALGLQGVFLPKIRNMHTDALLVVCPEHVQTLQSQGFYSKARLRQRIQEATQAPLSTMLADSVSGAGIQPAAASRLSREQLDKLTPKFAKDSYIHIIVAGADAGKFSAALHGWVGGEVGSIPVSRQIEGD